MYAYSHSGLGQLEDSGSVDMSGILIIGAIALLTLMLVGSGPKELLSFESKPKRRKSTRGEYVRHVAKKHKLSKADQQWLMEHEE